jgi:hypothetical protein
MKSKRAGPPVTAVTRTDESSWRTTTAPSACLAITPVSSVIVRPPISTDTLLICIKFSVVRRASAVHWLVLAHSVVVVLLVDKGARTHVSGATRSNRMDSAR